MALTSPTDLLTQELKEIHSAERQLSRALPKLAKAHPRNVYARCSSNGVNRAPL
jgi:ferritin-like metal-binding protein YciE